MIFKMRFFDNLMTSYLKILKIDQSPKIFKGLFIGVYLVGKYTFLTSFGLWENFKTLGFRSSQTCSDPSYAINKGLKSSLVLNFDWLRAL